MKTSIAAIMLGAGLLAGCQQKKTESSKNETTAIADTADAEKTTEMTAYQPQLFYNLPIACNTPDGLTLDAQGNILLSCPNFNKPEYPAKLYRVSKDTIQVFFDMPKHPETGKAAPMDLAFGPDGNLYVADNQYNYDKNYKSRLIRIRMQNGKPVKAEVVVEGFRLSNAVVWKGDSLFVSDSQWDTPAKPRESAIFQFTLAELTKKKVKLMPGFTDPHILATFTTDAEPDSLDNGADGIDFDSKGNLFTGLFGSGVMYKLTFKPNGSLASNTVFVANGKIPCVDGIVIDRKNDRIYVADSKSNAIRMVSASGEVSTLWENGKTDGTNGLLDQPAEPLLKGNQLYISNYDKPDNATFKNTGFDAPYTLSVIQLPQ